MNIHIDSLQNPLTEEAKKTLQVIWVPSEKVVVHRIEQPTAPKRKWDSLIPWLLEERLLQAVEEMHFVILGQNADTSIDVLVTSKITMQNWLDQCAQFQVQPLSLLPDYFALPWQQGEISLAIQGNKLLVRSSEFSGFVTSLEQGWKVIEKLMLTSFEPLSLSISHNTPIEKIPQSLQTKVFKSPQPLDWILASPVEEANLLRGEFTQQHSTQFSRGKWAIAALIVISLGVYFAFTTMSRHELEDEIAELEQEHKDQLSLLFPNLQQKNGNSQPAIEALIANRFKQKEMLASPSILLLGSLDRSLSRCNCSVESINLIGNSAEITLAKLSPESSPSFNIQGFHTNLVPIDQTNNYLLTIRQELNQ